VEETLSARFVPGYITKNVESFEREKLVAEAEDSSETRRKGNIRHCKPLPSNGYKKTLCML
jgi:hypothetical protein